MDRITEEVVRRLEGKRPYTRTEKLNIATASAVFLLGTALGLGSLLLFAWTVAP